LVLAFEEAKEFEVNPDTMVVGVEAMVEGFGSTVGCVGCNFFGHEDVVKGLGSRSVCGNFVVEANFTGMNVDETKVRCKLGHPACGTAKFFVEIPAEYYSMIVVDFGLEK
jgi:hypothetical protein